MTARFGESSEPAAWSRGALAPAHGSVAIARLTANGAVAVSLAIVQHPNSSAPARLWGQVRRP